MRGLGQILALGAHLVRPKCESAPQTRLAEATTVRLGRSDPTRTVGDDSPDEGIAPNPAG